MKGKLSPGMVSLLLAGIATLIMPHLLLAQQSGLVPCSGVMDCQFCSVAQLIQNIINFLVQLSIPIAAALFAYAGFLYATAGVTGKTDQYKKATGIFSAVGIGFVLTLVGWLAVNTILSVLLGNGPYSGGKWFDIPCVEQAYRDTGANGTIGGLLNDLVSGSLGGGGVGSGGGGSGQGVGTVIADGAIGQINKSSCSNCVSESATGNCTDNRAGCTYLGGVTQGTIDGLQVMAATCPGCTFNITGAAEPGHAEGGSCTHANGCKLDFSLNPALDTYITSGNNIGVRSDGATQYQNGNRVCAKESNHWDCSFSK